MSSQEEYQREQTAKFLEAQLGKMFTDFKADGTFTFKLEDPKYFKVRDEEKLVTEIEIREPDVATRAQLGRPTVMTIDPKLSLSDPGRVRNEIQPQVCFDYLVKCAVGQWGSGVVRKISARDQMRWEMAFSQLFSLLGMTELPKMEKTPTSTSALKD